MWRIVTRDDIPQVLVSLDLPGIANYMKSDSCKNILVMVCSIRPDHHLYFRLITSRLEQASALLLAYRTSDLQTLANLARLNLPYPEAVFDISFFKRNPRPFYVLAHELAPGKFRPTLTHAFIKLLADKGLLHTCFTQNIDTLERAAGVPESKIVEAHGSFADQHCVTCGAPYPTDKIKKKIERQEIPICECGGYVKPDIVFFGESLSEGFFRGIPHLRNADLLIVMGTSLTVHPFASLTELVPEECPRLLINLDHVGGWGSRANDVACLMPCDRAVRELCALLGWEKELDFLWAETDPAAKKRIPTPISNIADDSPEKSERNQAKSITAQGMTGQDSNGEEDEKRTKKEALAKAEAEEKETPKEEPEKHVDLAVGEQETLEEDDGAGIGKEGGREAAEEKREDAKGTDSDGKQVDGELLADVMEELVESISEVRLGEVDETSSS